MHYPLILAIALFTAPLHAEQPVIHVHIPPPQYTINNYTNTSNELSLDNKTSVLQEAYLLNTSTNIQNIFNQARDQAQEYTHGLFSWVAQNKKKTILYSAALGYGYVWYKLFSLNYALSQATCWSRWHETLSLEQLLAKPQQEVATDLLTTIQRHYTTPERIDDLIGPLIAFVHDVDTEITQLRQLVTLHVWIDRLRISFLFPKQSDLRAQAQDNINRLTYLKNLLLNWVSEHKVAQLTTIQTT